MNLLHPQVFDEGFTQSELDTLSRCPMRWNLKYNHRLNKPGAINWYFIIGHALHAWMQVFYVNFSTPPKEIATLQFPEGSIPSRLDIDLLAYWNAILPVMLEAYEIYYKEDYLRWKPIKTEREVIVDYSGFKLRGKIDLTIEASDGLFIVDHKTTARLNRDLVAGWDFRFQFMFYLWLTWKLGENYNGYIVNAIKKPELRQKKTEDLAGFAARVRDDMICEPEKYFYREVYPVTKDALEHFETEVLDNKLRKLDYLKNQSLPPRLTKSLIEDKNTAECQAIGKSTCEFIDICRHGLDKMKSLYETREHKHQELDNTIEV